MKRRGAGVLWDTREHVHTVTFTALQCGLGHAWFYCRTVTNNFQSDGNFFQQTTRIPFFLLLVRRLTTSISKQWLYRRRNCGKNKWELVEERTARLCAIWMGKTARNRDWRRELQKVSTLRYLEIASGIAVSGEEKQMKMSAKEGENERDGKRGGWKNPRLARSDRKLMPMPPPIPRGFQRASDSPRGSRSVRSVAKMRLQGRTFACFIKAYRSRSREIDY